MRERPILFSAPMVRAILDGTKTQTRRVVKPAPMMVTDHKTAVWEGPADSLLKLLDGAGRHCPYGQPGDRLWVREAFAFCLADKFGPTPDSVIYRADEGNADWPHGWKPSIHMPRCASRITLEVTAVRVERLNDISEKDAWAEGCEGFDDDVTGGKSGYLEFAELWESINGPGSWDANPWVWVVEFRKLGAGETAI
jgi:hypothetical protein